MTITNLNDSLYSMIVVSVGTKSMFVETVYNQKLSDSSHIYRGLCNTEGVGHEWVLVEGVGRDQRCAPTATGVNGNGHFNGMGMAVGPVSIAASTGNYSNCR